MHNLEPQFVPSMGICTVEVCVHSWCSIYGTFKYCYFFEQLCPTKMGIKLAFFEGLIMKISANWSLQPGLHFAIFSTEIGAVVQKLWYFEWDTSHSVKILSCMCTQNGYHCDLRKNTQFKIFLAESVSIQPKGASVNTIKDIIFCFWAV